MSKIKFLFFFLFSFFFFLSSRSQTPKQWLKLGDEAAEDGDFYGAAIYYKKSLLLDSANLLYNYKYAEALRKYNDYELSAFYYEEVLNADEKKQFPEAQFWLATMQKFMGQYDSAKENFRQFEKSYKENSPYFSKKAKQEIKSCEFAKKLIQDTIDVKIKNSGDLLNSFNSEINAFLLNDSTLYFSALRSDSNQLSQKNYRFKIYQAIKQDSVFKMQNPMDEIINDSSFHTANGCFSLDKKRFYFSRCDKKFKCELFVSEWKDEKWQLPVKLENGINMENFSCTQPMIAEIDSSEVLFFVSDMPEGKGKMDIWTINLSAITKGKTNLKPKNLSKINTIDNDISPFYDSENKTLYFSSEWYFGLGGFDIFKSTGTEKTFESPENIGYPFNTNVNDFYFSFYTKTKNGFLTSNRKGSFSEKNETCCNDIYQYYFPEKNKIDTLIAEEIKIAKKISSLEMLNKYLPVTLYFHNDEPNPKSWDTTTDFNYMKTYIDYNEMTDIYKEEYSKDLDAEKMQNAQKEIENFFSGYVEKGMSDLELFSELLLKELERGKKIQLAVKGYASPLAKTDYNVNLTLRRISSLENFLKETLDGAYIPYLRKSAQNGGKLEIIKIPFGEYKSDTTVSDNLNDQRNSVYSRKAALERKIEIISFSEIESDSLFSELFFETEIFDFGKAQQGEKLSHAFKFKNKGNQNLKILNVVSSCGCTIAKWTRNELLPNSEGEIEVEFNTEGKYGKELKTVTIETNGKPSIRTIQITAEITEK